MPTKDQLRSKLAMAFEPAVGLRVSFARDTVTGSRVARNIKGQRP